MTDLWLPRRLNHQIRERLQEHSEKIAEATASGGISYDRIRVMTSPSPGAPFEEKVLDVSLLEEDIKELYSQMKTAAEDILRVSAALPLEYRAPLNLYYVVMISQREVAEVLGISDRAVRKRLRKARMLFREGDGQTDV